MAVPWLYTVGFLPSPTDVDSVVDKMAKVLLRVPISVFRPYHSTHWSLALRNESRLKVFDKNVMRKIFGPNRHKVT
jgi:hypothetical protein